MAEKIENAMAQSRDDMNEIFLKHRDDILMKIDQEHDNVEAIRRQMIDSSERIEAAGFERFLHVLELHQVSSSVDIKTDSVQRILQVLQVLHEDEKHSQTTSHIILALEKYADLTCDLCNTVWVEKLIRKVQSDVRKSAQIAGMGTRS
jgi:hypothetical protein